MPSDRLSSHTSRCPLPTYTTPLAQRLASQVQSSVRTRGTTYFRKGAVIQIGGDDANIQAEVQGTRLYTVWVGPGEGEGELDAYCSCRYFEDRFDICKHIWAVIHYADRHRLLNEARMSEDLALIPDLRFMDRFEDPPEVAPSTRRQRGIVPWEYALRNAHRPEELSTPADPIDPEAWQIAYLIDTPTSPRGISVTVTTREQRADGLLGKPRPWRVNDGAPFRVPDPRDAEILALLLGSSPSSFGVQYDQFLRQSDPHLTRQGESTFFLRRPTEAILLERMCLTGRALVNAPRGLEPVVLRWDDGPPWDFRLMVTETGRDGRLQVRARLVRGEESVALTDPRLRISNAVVLIEDVVAPVATAGEGWIDLATNAQPIEIPAEDHDAFLEKILLLPGSPQVELPAGLNVEASEPEPVPLLIVDEPDSSGAPARMVAQLRFDYAGHMVRHRESGLKLYDRAERRLLVRDPDAERAAADRLVELGFRLPRTRPDSETTFSLAARNFGPAVRQLIKDGWRVEVKGKRYRNAGEFQLEVTSGIDWFDLHGSLAYGETHLKLPELLRAATAGETFVRLDDGSIGLIPEDWMAKYGLLGNLGKSHEDGLRFSRTHVAVLDALLATLPEPRYDDRFSEARRRLSLGAGVGPASPPASFQGTLRDYQKDGLGWIGFLRDSGFGGCLADDMGLGKTVQVLALLEARRHEAGDNTPRLPSLVVVPRSVLWNWHTEAERFAPNLRVLVHSGPNRQVDFPDCDLVLTTYATLHRDILKFQEVAFDYVVLDEAQAIKNARTGRAKAVRLLKARHRLALSGTPIENHLGELWSLFEFLNPGMLGSAAGFQRLALRNGTADAGNLSLVARAVRPFILRRTKEQVASELPARSEQTLICELKGKQLRRYRELREHYRTSLKQKVDEVGLNRSKIHVLEALLRLRQAACHPALIDPEFEDEEGAKIEALLPLLREIIDEGHKALVFSQFTRFLAIVRRHLDDEGIPYEYLDGRTRKREEKIARFQEDPQCPLFLISLKAGGLGLNLTAADYVFLLDPWWNPAVEAQAIDRAHRIGQTRQVFAYRLIARDTVEERILELQDAKRDLATSIITEDRSLMQKLAPEDLEILLS